MAKQNYFHPFKRFDGIWSASVLKFSEYIVANAFSKQMMSVFAEQYFVALHVIIHKIPNNVARIALHCAICVRLWCYLVLVSKFRQLRGLQILQGFLSGFATGRAGGRM